MQHLHPTTGRMKTHSVLDFILPQWFSYESLAGLNFNRVDLFLPNQVPQYYIWYVSQHYASYFNHWTLLSCSSPAVTLDQHSGVRIKLSTCRTIIPHVVRLMYSKSFFKNVYEISAYLWAVSDSHHQRHFIGILSVWLWILNINCCSYHYPYNYTLKHTAHTTRWKHINYVFLQ